MSRRLFLTFCLPLFVFMLISCQNREQKLLQAIQEHQVLQVKQLILEGADLHARDYQGSPFLHSAITAGDPEILKILIQNGAGLEERNPYGLTPLHWAVFYGYLKNSIQITDILLKSGARITSETPRGLQALHLAATQGDRAMIQLLVKSGASVNGQGREGNGATPLHIAAYFGKYKIVPQLIQSGSNVNALDYLHQSPLDLALTPFTVRARNELNQLNDPDRNKALASKLLLAAGAKPGRSIPVKARKIESIPIKQSYSDLDYGFPVHEIDLGKNFGKIAYLDEGKGALTLVFVHGVARYAKYFQEQIRFFKSRFRVIAVDLPGYGKSEAPHQEWSATLHSEALVCLIQKLNLNPVILIGHSYGSNVILQALEKIPDQLLGAVLITLPGVQPFTEEDQRWIRDHWNSLLKTKVSQEEIIDYWDHSLIFEKNSLTEFFLKENLNLNLTGNFSKALEIRNQVLMNSYLRQETKTRIRLFKEAQIPLLIIAGKQDRVIPVFQPGENYRPGLREYYEDICSWNAHAQCQFLDQCGHMPILEKPLLINQMISSFIMNKCKK